MLIETIKLKANAGKGISTAVIEYNFELPEHPHIKKDSFFGVKAKYNKDLKKGVCNLIYTM